MQDLLKIRLDADEFTASSLSIDALRRAAGCDHGLKDELEYGRCIPAHVHHLNQYLFTYGIMVSRQWQQLHRQLRQLMRDSEHLLQGPVHLYDYGAGQGLSTLAMVQALAGLVPQHLQDCPIAHIYQLDPSEVALQRAAAIARCVAPHAQRWIHRSKRSQTGWLLAYRHTLHVHVFSNSIDVPNFLYADMIADALHAPGRHLFVVVSNDREQHGGTTQVREAYHLLMRHCHAGHARRDLDTGLTRFTVQGATRCMRAISFITHITVP